VIRAGKTETISTSELKINNIVLVKPGSKMPANKKIINNKSNLNKSIITNKSKPISKQHKYYRDQNKRTIL
jgi:cation transport ATPase